MLLEQQGGEGTTQGPDVAFTNEDGTPATWLEVIPERDRRRAFAWRAGIGFFVAFILWGLQYGNGALDLAWGWVGLMPIAVGLAMGSLAYRDSTPVRRYTTVRAPYTDPERFYRAFKWWFWPAASVIVFWWVQFEAGSIAKSWWLASLALPFFLVGVYRFRAKEGMALSPAAIKAKVYFDMLEQRADEQPSLIDKFWQTPFARYPVAALFLYGAYYFGVESVDKDSGWLAIAAIVVAGILARELSKWLLWLALVGAITWAVIAGISALPVSAAIIVGALIIASAMKK
ncbi:hypothetical protein [Cupriavidus necator]